MENWYRIKENVEYSTNFNFFKQEQVTFVKRGITYKFISRLESKVFRLSKPITRESYEFSESDIDCILKEIHAEILMGKHGEGEIVN